MHFSLSTQFCLRILAFAASVNRKTTTREIAQFYGLPLDRVRKAARRLGRLGFLATERGQTGGLRLARPSTEISLGPVVRSLEGASENARDNGQNRSLTEAVRGAIEEAESVFWQKLDHVSLADVAHTAAHRDQQETQRAA